MLDSKLRTWWDKAVGPVGRGLTRLHVSPNAVTVAGLIVQAVAAVFILQGRLMAAGLTSAVSGIADLLDGAIAKASGRSTRFGALLDSTADRIADALFFVPVAWLYGVEPDVAHRSEPWVAAVALGGLVAAFLVSYVKARAQSLGFECNVGIAERAERYVLMVLALVLDVVPAAVVILAVLSAVTFLQRLEHVRRQVARAD